MTDQEIQRIIEKGEGITVEFKRAESGLPRNLFETVCAFLNRNGGTILLGVDDDKALVGLNEAKVENLCKQFNNPKKWSACFCSIPRLWILRAKS